MRKPKPLEPFDRALSRYLETRHALGRAYVSDEHVLGSLRSFLARTRRADLDAAGFDAWRKQYVHLSMYTRVRCEHAAHRFCRYRRRTEPDAFVPDSADLARLKSRKLPTLIESHQVIRLLDYARGLKPSYCYALRPEMLRIAVVLLYTTGIRRGELVRLTMDDIDPVAGILRIRESKFHKSRWVPLSESAAQELKIYLRARRRAGFSEGSSAPLLCDRQSRPCDGDAMWAIIKQALRGAGVRSETGRVPRVHDFRHSFAVGALLRWYQADGDVQTQLPKLAMYMGHVSIVSTAYYLRWMPAVVEKTSERFARAFEHTLQGGAR